MNKPITKFNLKNSCQIPARQRDLTILFHPVPCMKPWAAEKRRPELKFAQSQSSQLPGSAFLFAFSFALQLSLLLLLLLLLSSISSSQFVCQPAIESCNICRATRDANLTFALLQYDKCCCCACCASLAVSEGVRNLPAGRVRRLHACMATYIIGLQACWLRASSSEQDFSFFFPTFRSVHEVLLIK